ncbi:MAG: pyrroloquinoline-quinone synthase PqqC [Alphaproteobacteria bacterium]|nr:pyrroloquinoline-quinone synthase PqqC [Alphaproteobacteria bacterium]
MTASMSPDELEHALREIGSERYHDKHPFHHLLHTGKLNKGQIQAWALNRYIYQSRIPIKDASLLARCPDMAVRQVWRQRIIDHDGAPGSEGGIERWLKLAEGLGLSREDVVGERLALPATHFAVEAYVRFVREKSLLEAIASSLTEMFAPGIIRTRMDGMLANYAFVSRETLAYFAHRTSEAPRDAEFALAYVKRHATTREDQQRVLDALTFKCQVLWAQLDALHFAYVSPGLPPPGAFVPDAP